MEDHENDLTTVHFVFLCLSWAIFQAEMVVYVIVKKEKKKIGGQILSLLF